MSTFDGNRYLRVKFFSGFDYDEVAKKAGVIKFQDTLEVVIKEKKSKFVLKACSRQNKKLMLATTVSSAAQIVDGVIILFLKNSQFFIWGIASWFVLLVLTLALVGKYGLNENTIDNLGNA